jgi:hypothetical protein
LASVVFLLGAFVPGCATGPAVDRSGAEERERALGNLAEAEFGPPDEVLPYPRLTARTKISGERLTADPLMQADGGTFSVFEEPAVGYPATLQLENRGEVAAEIARLEIRRRTVGKFGRYEEFLGTEPLVLEPGEAWEGTFLVSRTDGWYRLEARPVAPEGWAPVHGAALRRVFFRADRARTDAGERLALTFWNEGGDPVVFRYWLAEGVPEGVPEDPLAVGVVRLGPGETESRFAPPPSGDWALVTRPGAGEG